MWSVAIFYIALVKVNVCSQGSWDWLQIQPTQLIILAIQEGQSVIHSYTILVIVTITTVTSAVSHRMKTTSGWATPPGTCERFLQSVFSSVYGTLPH